MYKKITLTAAFLFLISVAGYAQTPKECASMKYQDFNKTEPARQAVKTIAGTVKLDGSEHMRVSSCVAVYEEATKKLVKVMYLNLKQRFEFKDIPEGEYRIVVKEKDGFFCPSNTPVKVDKSAAAVKDAIAIVLTRPGADSCSYNDLKT